MKKNVRPLGPRLSLVRAELTSAPSKTDKVFGCSPCTYSDVMSLDSELYAYERTLPLAYELPIDAAGRVHFGVPPSPTEMRSALIQLCLSAEFVRLHRPFLGMSLTHVQPYIH